MFFFKIIYEKNRRGFSPVTFKNTEKKSQTRLTTIHEHQLSTKKKMKKAGKKYDQLIMGFGGGDRVLINDRKLNSGRDTAYVINLERDTGIEDVKL